MPNLTEQSSSQQNRNHLQTPKSRFGGEIDASTATSIAAALKNPHENSLITTEQNLPHYISNPTENFEKFSSSLLKNKNLLVPTRLALKRQRATLKSPTKQILIEYVNPNTLQMELGNADGNRARKDDESDDGGNTTLVSSNNQSIPDTNRLQSRSNRSSPTRGDTPHTLPTDISLLYREKPLFSHPVTGHYILEYTEDNGSPSPCSYVLPRKSCREKNAPSYSFGSRCLVEKKGGSRTGWQKQWFAHSDPYTTKVDFNREPTWPTPAHYPPKTTLGKQWTKVSFPAWSIAARLQTNVTITPEDTPSPDTYDTLSAFKKLTAKNTHITLKSRLGGTQVPTLQNTDPIPAPNAYDSKKFLSNKSSAPKHSFGKRFPTSYAQDPYVNTLPPLEI